MYESIPVAITNGNERIQVLNEVLTTADKRAPAPARRKGTAKLDELASFIDHINRFKAPESVVFASSKVCELIAVYNYHPEGPEQNKAAWGDHRAVYGCPISDTWKRWRDFCRTRRGQEELAEFIEDHLEDLTSGKKNESFPTPLSVLEIMRDLRIHTKGRFEKKMNRATGEYSLVCKQEHESSSTAIPRTFLIGLPVFEGGALHRVEVRLRLRLLEGTPRFELSMHRYREIEAAAFAEVRKAVAEKTGLPVYAGSPECC
jgi:uncharacterized protein YfdQ (DUF2303 family)